MATAHHARQHYHGQWAAHAATNTQAYEEVSNTHYHRPVVITSPPDSYIISSTKKNTFVLCTIPRLLVMLRNYRLQSFES